MIRDELSLLARVGGLIPRTAASVLLSACAADAPTGTDTVPISIVNASFETPVIANGAFLTTSPPAGWSGFGSLNAGSRAIGVLRPATTTLYTVPAPEGNNVGVVFLLDNAGNHAQFANSPAGLQQTLSASLQTQTTYTLVVEVGNIANDVAAPFAFGGFPNYRVDLLAGGVVVASDVGTQSPADGRFATSTVSLVVGAAHLQAGLALGIRLVNLNAAAGIEVNFDDVRLSSVRN